VRQEDDRGGPAGEANFLARYDQFRARIEAMVVCRTALSTLFGFSGKMAAVFPSERARGTAAISDGEVAYAEQTYETCFHLQSAGMTEKSLLSTRGRDFRSAVSDLHKVQFFRRLCQSVPYGHERPDRKFSFRRSLAKQQKEQGQFFPTCQGEARCNGYHGENPARKRDRRYLKTGDMTNITGMAE